MTRIAIALLATATLAVGWFLVSVWRLARTLEADDEPVVGMPTLIGVPGSVPLTGVDWDSFFQQGYFRDKDWRN